MSRLPLQILFLVCAAMLTRGVEARPPAQPWLRGFGLAEGLPSSQIHALAQDAEGRLWIGTADGLARFDGVDFTVWQHDPADVHGLPANLTQALMVDSKQRLWIACEGAGLVLWDAAQNRFVPAPGRGGEALSSADVVALAQSADGSIWAGTFGKGLFRLSADGDGAWTQYLPSSASGALPADIVLSLAAPGSGEMWVGTTAGAARWRAGRFEQFPEAAIGMVFSLNATADGSVWLGGAQGALRWQGDAFERPEMLLRLPNPKLMAVQQDRDGDTWFGTHAGAVHVGAAAESLVQSLPPPLNTVSVFAVLRDREGALWWGTRGRGLWQMPADWRRFSRIVLLPEDVAAKLRAAVPAAEGGVWVIADGGLFYVDTTGVARRELPSSALSEQRLWSVFESSDGSVWIGDPGGLLRYVPDQRKLSAWRIGDAADAPLPAPIDLIFEAPDHTIWTSSYGLGVQARTLEGRLLRSITAESGAGLPTGDTEQIGLGPDQSMWLAGAGGLLRWDSRRSRFVPVVGAPAGRIDAFAFRGDRVYLHRTLALERFVWDGTRLRREAGAIGSPRLPALDAGGMHIDAEHRVWLSSARGLFRIDPRDNGVRVFGVRDGLPSQEFAPRPFFVDRDGVALLVLDDALLAFDTRFKEPSAQPMLRIERLQLRRGEQTLRLDPAQAIKMRHDDRDLRVIVRLHSLAAPHAHRYQSRLLGFDRDWGPATAGERVWSQLAPGSYSLSVRAAAEDGVWLEQRPIELLVLPPWWASSPALLGYVLAIAGMLVAAAQAYRLRLRRRHAAQLIARERELALQTSANKSQFLATLGHEIRTPMTGVLGMTELLADTTLDFKQRRYVEAIGESGSILLRLVNDALDLARVEAGRLELVSGDFDPVVLLHGIAEQLRPLAARKGINLDCAVVDQAAPGLRGDRARIQQILLNLGQNAIKFTERGAVRLRLCSDPAFTLAIDVDDDGPGLDTEQQARLFQRFEQFGPRQTGVGLGLAISRELAHAMGGELTVHSTPGAGASFRLRLPLALAATNRVGVEPIKDQAETASPRREGVALRVLLVEDDPIVAEVLVGMLRRSGHAVTAVENGLAALSEIALQEFDCAVLDLDLPQMDGLALAGLLRMQLPQLRLIAVSARSVPDTELRCREAGFEVFLRKPVAAADLLRALDRKLHEQQPNRT